MRFGMSVLRDKALAALEEVAERAEEAPVAKSAGLRFLLAFLAQFAEERWPFDQFWREATATAPIDSDAGRFGRHQAIRSSLAAIYLQLGLRRPAR